MRLIGTIEGEKRAYRLNSFFQKEGIECTYYLKDRSENVFQFWVIDEDKVSTANHWIKEFQKKPDDHRFNIDTHPIDSMGIKKKEQEPLSLKILRLKSKKHKSIPTTRLIIITCFIFYIWNGFQISRMASSDEGLQGSILTPLMIHFAYEIPNVENRQELEKWLSSRDETDKNNVWDGIYGVALNWPKSKKELQAPMFIQIRNGQLWRLITPVLLHGGFLHILFNMLWLWLLGRQIEERLRFWQYILLTLIIGIFSNTFQYLMSGPLFLGYSGIICGLAGFIWVRQRNAPWEGYPLPSSTLIFLAVFVFGMMCIQLVSFFTIRFGIANFSTNIANTAHIAGAIAGILLGKISLFAKRSS